MWQVLILCIILLKGITPASSNTITSIHRYVNANTKFCLDTKPTANKFQLEPTVGGRPETGTNSEDIDENNCITFEWDITSSGGKHAHFVILAVVLNNSTTLVADVTVTVVPEFPTVTLTIGNDPDDTNTQILRVVGDLKTFELSDTLEKYQDPGLLSYYIGPITEEYLVPCSTAEPIVCEMLNPTQSLPVYDGTLVVSSVLKYLSTDSAEINIEITNSVDSVDILFKNTPGDNKACKGNTGKTGTCQIPWRAADSAADLRIVTVSRNLMTHYNKNPIQDHKLLLQGISSTTVEAEWIQNSVNKFQLTAYKEGATGSNDIVTVDCSNLVAYCLGFVTGLDANTLYSVVLQQYNEASKAYSTVNQIQSLSAQTLSAKAEIHHIRMDCHHNGKGSTVQVCFQHTSDDYEERKHSRYELVLLNDNRQWLRHKLITNETGNLCFSPISVNQVDFDIHQGVTLIVTNRAQDEVTVLATGETYISID